MPSFFSDTEFSELLHTETKNKDCKIHILANKFYVKIHFTINVEPNNWIELGVGELGIKTKEILKTVSKKKLFLTKINEQDISNIQPDFNNAELLNLTILNKWIKESETLTTGRKGEVSVDTRFEVAYTAAWRCQFEGCGIDLRQHLTPSMSGNYSYFAHIVASSEEGPRGNSESEALANDPTNIMLLCDKCHRLIDRIAPNDYDAEKLRAMRERNIREVKRLLDCLQLPDAQMVVIGGAIEGQPFIFNSRAAEEAMWLKNMRSPYHAEYFINNTSYFSASNNPSYWSNAFQLLKTIDIPRIKSFLQGTGRNGDLKPLAVFALHGTSILILSGRLIGDSSSAQLFQYHRQQLEGRGRQWAWPDVPEPDTNKYKVKILKEATSSDSEAILQIHLTAVIPSQELPEHLFDSEGFKLPAIELTIDDCHFNAISHPKDLELLGNAIDSIYRKIQDEWRIKKVHLFVVAPATACVRIGQKMQARHHADFILYERKPSVSGTGSHRNFEPTIKVSSTKVVLVSTDEQLDIA